MKSAKDILKIYSVKGNTVNSIDKNITTVNSNTVDSNKPVWEEIEDLISSRGITPEGIAQHIAETLEDEKSLKLYTLLVKEHSSGRLLDAMHQTKEAWKDGRIRTKMPIYFLAILRRWGFKTNFKKEI